MTAWTITPAPVAPDLDHPDAWAVHGAAAVSAAVDLDHWGHTDAAFTAAHLLARLHDQSYLRRVRLVATAPDGVGDAAAVVGLAQVDLPLTSNTHHGQVDVIVHPAHRRQGIGTALLEAGEAIAREAGRTSLISASEHPGEPPADDPRALVAPTGSGRISPDAPGAVFAARHGYALAQAERYSMLQLPVDPGLLDRLHNQARAAAGGSYELVGWSDRAPDDLVDGYAALETRMSTDAPQGDLDLDEDPWDAARVRAAEAERAASGQGFRVVAARHVTTGELAGFTMVEYPLDRPEVVEQADTIVLPTHRGHRLGMLLKTAMVRELAVARPGARRVHTWNAEENEHMLAINVALGFRPLGVVGVWQKSLVMG